MCKIFHRAPRPHARSCPNTSAAAGGHERILLVDDDKTVAETERQMLERFGYQVTFCLSSVEALAAFRADPAAYDLVVTDMTMPGLDGLDLVEKLRATRSNLPVIVCTGFSENLDSAQTDAPGIDAFLMKPVAMSEMGRAVRKVLDSKGSCRR